MTLRHQPLRREGRYRENLRVPIGRLNAHDCSIFDPPLVFRFWNVHNVNRWTSFHDFHSVQGERASDKLALSISQQSTGRGVNFMWSRSYRKHVIMAFPSFDTATNLWAPQADISWPTGPERESEFVRFPIRVMSESEAVACALSRGKSWIDRRLKHRSDSNAESNLVVQGIASLQERLTKIHPKPAMRIQSIMPKYSTAPITFDQFKSTVARIGANSTDSSLRKSYSALMKLQKSVNCSWAEIKRRIEQSQGKPTTAQPGTRRNNSRWLPLTERDWRRIVA